MAESTQTHTPIRLDAAPHPLPPGEVVGERFEVQRVLGRGGFGIAYLVDDVRRGDQAVVKELAPVGMHRSVGGVLDLDSLGPEAAHRLRQRFLEEARVLSRLNVRGVSPVRARFSERGTAYYATEYHEGAVTLEHVLSRTGRMDVDGALDLLYQLLETLESVHAKGVLHRDIKPANILVLKDGAVELIDFGAAREWHADTTMHNTALFTPAYAPLEQMSERGKRGPSTDIYALCATMYHALTGMPPTAATDRALGAVLLPIHNVRPEVELSVARAIESGLAVKADERPASIDAFRELLSAAEGEIADTPLETFDARLLEIQRLNVERRECPGCGDVLEDPKPLRRGVCPVCHEGSIKKHEFDMRLCPICQAGTLKKFSAADRPVVCPICSIGWLSKNRKSMLSREIHFECPECAASFEQDGADWTLTSAELNETDTTAEPVALPASEWLARSGRGLETWRCDGCGAQLDAIADGRLKQIVPKPTGKYSALHPEEWARVAAGRPPACGNGFCTGCDADYFIDGDQVTLLAWHEDSSGFAAEHAGRRLDWEELRWLGIGKESPHPGVTCRNCKTEFDRESNFLRLVRTHQKRLRTHLGEPHTLEDWHRIAKGLPQVHEEGEFLTRFDSVLVQAYRDGAVDFDSKRESIWRGPAARTYDDRARGTLSVTRDEMSFGGVLRKWRVPLDGIVDAQGSEQILTVALSGQSSRLEFEVEEAHLTARLPSGTRTVLLGPDDLAARIKFELSSGVRADRHA